MNDKKWVIPYVILFFLIFIPTTLFLFSGDHLKSIIHRITIVSLDPEYKDHLSPAQSVPNDPASCINDLYNKFQSGMLDLDSLREGIGKCFSLNPDNGDNNSQVVPEPQPPTANTPRFV